MKVVAFNGSPRGNGNTAILLETVLAELDASGIETRLVQMGPNVLQGCTGCYRCLQNLDKHCAKTDDALNDYVDLMLEADGILLGTPTYFTDLTTNMKSLIDRAGFVSRANGRMLRRKVGAGVVAVRRAGAIHAFDTLNHFFLISEMMVPGSIYWNIGIGLQPGDVSGDLEGLETMKALGRNMAWLLGKLNA